MFKNKLKVGALVLVSAFTVIAQEAKVENSILHSNSKAWRDLEQKVNNLAANQMSFLSFGALLEIAAVYDESVDSVDFTLATLEVGLEAEISSWARAEVVFLYEEDDTDPIDVDTGIISFGNTEVYPVFVQIGRMYVPFGNYDSFCITDPLTLEIGETRESAGLIGIDYSGFSGNFTCFNGDVETDDKDSVNNFTAALMYMYEKDDLYISVGGSYIYNISDSDGLQDVISNLDDVNEAAGINVFATAGWMRIGLSIEYVTAIDELSKDLAIEPSALSVDLGYEFTEAVGVALRYETAEEVEELELPEDRFGFCVNWTFNNTDLGAATLSAEYMHEEYKYESSNDILTLQISFEI